MSVSEICLDADVTMLRRIAGPVVSCRRSVRRRAPSRRHARGWEVGLVRGVSALARGSVAAPSAGEAGGQFRDASQRLSDRTARSVTFTHAQDDLRRPWQSTSSRDDQSSPVMASAPRTPRPRSPAVVKVAITAVIAATVEVDGVDLFGDRRVRSHHRHWLKRPDSAASVGAAAIAAAAAPVTSIGVMKFSFVRMGLLQ
jgi:hypothetical protein